MKRRAFLRLICGSALARAVPESAWRNGRLVPKAERDREIEALFVEVFARGFCWV